MQVREQEVSKVVSLVINGRKIYHKYTVQNNLRITKVVYENSCEWDYIVILKRDHKSCRNAH